MQLSLAELKRFIVIGWAGWITLVTATNVLEALKALGALPANWAVASGNWGALLEATGRYQTPVPIVALLFAGVIAWQAIAAWCCWDAVNRYRPPGPGLAAVDRAFAVMIPLWFAFMIAEELFLAYSFEPTHLRIMVAQIASLLAIHLLPLDKPAA